MELHRGLQGVALHRGLQGVEPGGGHRKEGVGAEEVAIMEKANVNTNATLEPIYASRFMPSKRALLMRMYCLGWVLVGVNITVFISYLH